MEFGYHSFGLFWIFVDFAASVISFLVPLFVSFLKTQGLHWLGGGRLRPRIIRRRLLPISAAVASFGMRQCGSERADRCQQRPAHHLFSFKLLDF